MKQGSATPVKATSAMSGLKRFGSIAHSSSISKKKRDPLPASITPVQDYDAKSMILAK